MPTLQELQNKYANQLRDFQYSPDVYLKKQWGLLPFNQYTDRLGFVVPEEITQQVWQSLSPQEQQIAIQHNPDLARWGIGGFAQVAGGTSHGAKLLESIQSPVTPSERIRDVGITGQTPEVLQAIDNLIKEKYAQGQVLNPNAQLNEQTLVDFMDQASREIDPYYSSQLKLAKESFLRGLGYSTEELLRQEQESERKYGRDLRTLGESAAEQGFAQSGLRQRGEEELARSTAFDIESTRRKFGFEAGTTAREFAQKFGTAGTAIPTIPEAPTITAGQPGFGRSERQLPMYELSPETYQGLVGSQEFEQRAAKLSRAAELEQSFRQRQSTPRYFNL